MVLGAVVIPALPWVRRCSSLHIAGTQRCLRSRSCCNFLYCVMVCLVTGWTTLKQCSLMSMIGPFHCELVETLMALRVMTRCIAWMEMLPGMRG
jgi:hypothetical protein